MAQSGYTPISLYYSTSASTAPSAGNLVAGELALNTTDEKLYFKNAAGTVKLLASNAGSTATVSSVAQTFTGGIVSVAGTPITTSGTLALTVAGNSGGVPYFSTTSAWASSGALTASALVLGGGAGAAPTPMGSLGTTTTVLHGNVAGAPTFGAVSLTADVTGNLPVANGGTGTNTLTANNVILGNGTSAPTFVAPSTSGNVLTSNGTTWASTAPAASGATKGQAIAFSIIFGL